MYGVPEAGTEEAMSPLSGQCYLAQIFPLENNGLCVRGTGFIC